MKDNLHKFCLGLIASLAAVTLAMNVSAEEREVNMKHNIDWSSFMQKQDPVWAKMPRKWLEAPYLGNGMMGTMVRQTGAQTVRWDVGRGDVQDHRPIYEGDLKNPTMFTCCRLPIGFFELKTAGKITGSTLRLDLWNAEATGEIQTDKGTIQWRSIVHADRMLILTEINPSEGESGCRWEWNTLPAVSPRFTRGNKWEGYEFNPPPSETREDNVNLCVQPLRAGGQTATAWTIDKGKGKRLLTVSVAHSYPGDTARDDAVQTVKEVAHASFDALAESHRAWWHDFYPQSFISIPDAEWEAFYWLQMYKLASATRADGMLIDNQGPWLQPTPWPGVWWNLNVELTYWPTYTSNRLGLGSSLGRHLYANVENLVNTVPKPYRHDSAAVCGATGQGCAGSVAAPNGENAPMMGLLLWGLHNCWLHYRHSMDDEILRDHLFPLLKRAVNYHYHFMTEDENGVLHIPKTFSPEYKHGKGPDSNFVLALLRWGCKTLIRSCERLDIDDPLLPKWRDTLENLADYPTNENGFMIARGVPFAHRHRHYSHLLMIYPLYLVNADQEGAEELAMESIKHWQSFGARHGYALTGASSMAAAFGRGNEALEYLDGLKRYLSPTTMYSEAGGAPVIETPLSGAQCIHDMLIQSWGGTIRVFPAVPDAWDNIIFHNLRTEGAFLVSARRDAGRTAWVRIKSLAGEPCHIRAGLGGEVRIAGSRNPKLKELQPGLFALALEEGEEALLWSDGPVPEPVVTPVKANVGDRNPFGVK